jgi:hypothetical protein
VFFSTEQPATSALSTSVNATLYDKRRDVNKCGLYYNCAGQHKVFKGNKKRQESVPGRQKPAGYFI